MPTTTNDLQFLQEVTEVTPLDLRIRRAVNSIESILPCKVTDSHRVSIEAELIGLLQFHLNEIKEVVKL